MQQTPGWILLGFGCGAGIGLIVNLVRNSTRTQGVKITTLAILVLFAIAVGTVIAAIFSTTTYGFFMGLGMVIGLMTGLVQFADVLKQTAR